MLTFHECGKASVGAASARHFRKSLGGITGDLLGALEQASELALLLTYLACRNTG
mgnify:CR=1 FL=1